MLKVCRRRHKIHPTTEKAAAPGTSGGPVTVASALRSLARLLGLGLLYPLVPVALQLRLLCSEAGEAEVAVARETSLIFVTVEASLQTLLTLWLMLRGIIRWVPAQHPGLDIICCLVQVPAGALQPGGGDLVPGQVRQPAASAHPAPRQSSHLPPLPSRRHHQADLQAMFDDV